MLDFDLAALYQVTTSALNQAVKRNMGRFPDQFMFRLSDTEWSRIASQSMATTVVRRPKTFFPYAFTEHGVAMLAAVLRSQTAIEMNVSIMKSFVAMGNHICANSSTGSTRLSERSLPNCPSPNAMPPDRVHGHVARQIIPSDSVRSIPMSEIIPPRTIRQIPPEGGTYKPAALAPADSYFIESRQNTILPADATI